MPRLRPPSPAAAARALAVLGIALAAAAWMLYPAWLDGEHVLVGDWRHPDVLSNHWLYSWVADRLAHGQGILHNDRYYWPVGDAPWLAGNGGDAVPYALLAGLGPWPGTVTAWLAIALCLNAIATYALARRCGAAHAGALVGAATVGVSSYLAHELTGGRFSQVPIYWMVGFLTVFIGLLERPSVGRALAAGLLLGATSAVYWYYGLWAAWMAGILAIARALPSWARVRDAGGPAAWWRAGAAERLRAWALPAGIVAGAAALVALPVLALFLRHWREIPGTVDMPFPHPLALASALPFTFPAWSGTVERGEIVLPLVGLALAAQGVRAARDDWRVRGMIAIAVVFYLLALGPSLLLPSGTDTGIPGPFRVVYAPLESLRRYWWPYRHVVGVSVAVAVLAARGADLAFAALRPWGRALAVAALVAILPVDLSLRDGRAAPALSWWEPPDAYTALGRLPGEVVLELPLAPQLASSQQTLAYQRVHGKTLLNGHAMWVDRVRPRAWDAFVQANSFLRVLRDWERGQLFEPFAFRPEDVLSLRDAGLRIVVVNAEYLPGALAGLVDLYPAVLGALFGPPAYTFREHLSAWDLEAYNHQGFVDAPPFRLPPDYLQADGSRMLDVGHNRALGLRGLAREFPPVLPPGGEPGPGPVEQAPSP